MDETEPALKPETNTERWLMAMQVVDTAPVAAACDSRFGWYPKAAMNQLRRLMKKNLQQFLLDAGIKTNIDEYVKSTGKLRTDWMGSADLKSALKTTRLAAGGGADEEEEQGEDEDDDEEEEEEEDAFAAMDDDDDEEGDYMEHVVKRIAELFKQQTGRDPTPEEVQALLANMSGEPDDDEEEEESEEEDSDDEEEEEVVEKQEVVEEVLEKMTPEDMAKLLRGKLAEAFQQSQGRAPTEDEIDQLLEGLSQDTSLQDDMLRAGEQAAQTPAPAENKKRKLDEGAEENMNKKTSPASVTDPAATQ